MPSLISKRKKLIDLCVQCSQDKSPRNSSGAFLRSPLINQLALQNLLPLQILPQRTIHRRRPEG
ncbi:hypothetical protein J2Z69_000383 [Paenibacillus shirakamiensis]|uniref:Uncharacterized protein n=1 Tax=Paenibacillus shirakamiensis TaxID=1265935 RepID=A0ABS4JFJ0_9BACL|nr:hypothetical protein [Paenibacillus shirakamiensis]